VQTDRQMDEQKDMTKLRVVFRILQKNLKIKSYVRTYWNRIYLLSVEKFL